MATSSKRLAWSDKTHSLGCPPDVIRTTLAWGPFDAPYYRWTDLVRAASAGCASKSDNIAAAYVSPTQYAGFSCGQMREEAARLSGRAIQATGAQDAKASSDAVATGIGVILSGQALFMIKGDSTIAAEVARLKGEMEVLHPVLAGATP